MPTAVIVDAIRTPLGRRNGKLKDIHPVDLAAHVLRAVLRVSLACSPSSSPFDPAAPPHAAGPRGRPTILQSRNAC